MCLCLQVKSTKENNKENDHKLRRKYCSCLSETSDENKNKEKRRDDQVRRALYSKILKALGLKRIHYLIY